MISLQGMGLLHVLHLAVSSEHGCDGGHCGHSHEGHEALHAHGYVEATLSLHEDEGSGHHSHDAATCRICQTLAHLKAVSPAQGAGVFSFLLPAFQIVSAESFPLNPIALSALAPRAPPTSA
jgi:hypothetical protein